jgi:putative peptide zinc metalloprotease protein
MGSAAGKIRHFAHLQSGQLIMSSRDSLRADLRAMDIPGRRPRSVMIIDEWSGRFFRLPQATWAKLTSGQADASLLAIARSCGWTRYRNRSSVKSWRWSSLLALQIPLGSADRMARLVEPFSGFWVTRTAVTLWAIAILIAFVAMLGRIDSLVVGVTQLPAFLAGPGKWIALATLLVTKTLHELGHAIVCRRLGAKPKSFGIMLFFGIPCPYCDVTDSYRLTSRRDRIAVMSGGMYVELILATIAAFVWMATYKGMTDAGTVPLAALNVMLLCSVSTFIFNANPLMRYDGYFILADLVDSVDLRADARGRWRDLLTGAWRSRSVSTFAGGIYHVASTLYRWMVLVSMVTIVAWTADAIGLRWVAVVTTLMFLLTMMVSATRKVVKVLRGEEGWQGVGPWRRGLGTLGFVLGIIALITIPLPNPVFCDGEIELAGATEIFISVDGTVETVERVWGQAVRPGETLLTIRSRSLLHDQVKLASAVSIARTQARLVRQESIHDDEAANQWATVEENRRSTEMQLATLQQQIKQTQVSAPIEGRLLAPRLHPEPIHPTADSVHSIVSAGDSWGRIATANHLVAELIVPQNRRGQIRVGSPVQLVIDAFWAASSDKRTIVTTTIEDISPIHGSSETSNDRQLKLICRLPTDLALESEESELPWWTWTGSRCSARIDQPRRSLASRIGDFLSRPY